MKTIKHQKGFTLIELLVVISIIGLLASIILVALNGARQKARVAKRAGDLEQISKALELFYNDNQNSYPNPGWAWRSACLAFGSTPGSVGYAPNQIIPGLVSTYMSNFPSDPSLVASANQGCYMYLSNGTDYKFLDYNIPDMTLAQIHQYPAFVDKCRNDVQSCGWADGSLTWEISSPGGVNW